MKLYDSTLTSHFLVNISYGIYTAAQGPFSDSANKKCSLKMWISANSLGCLSPFSEQPQHQDHKLACYSEGSNKGPLLHLTPGPVCMPLCLKSITD